MSQLPDRRELEVQMGGSGRDDVQNQGRRTLLRNGAAGLMAAVFFGGLMRPETAAATGQTQTPWEVGKYQTFPRIVTVDENGKPKLDARGSMRLGLQLIDLGTLGPDVDTIFGIDFPGELRTGALVISRPPAGMTAEETRVVGIKRVDLETVQFQPALGGDRFDLFRISEAVARIAPGQDPNQFLDAGARWHASNTARRHQLVVYIGDLGKFQMDWPNEAQFLNSIIRAQRPSRVGIPEPDFVNPRTF